jgi:hypothetical protein
MKSFNTAWGVVTVKHTTEKVSTVTYVPNHLAAEQIGISLEIAADEAAEFGLSEANLFALTVDNHLAPFGK